jgi:hypothetical protein
MTRIDEAHFHEDGRRPGPTEDIKILPLLDSPEWKSLLLQKDTFYITSERETLLGAIQDFTSRRLAVWVDIRIRVRVHVNGHEAIYTSVVTDPAPRAEWNKDIRVSCQSDSMPQSLYCTVAI